MSTPEPNPYRKLNYPVNNLAQDFNATEKDQVRQNIGIPSSVNKTGKVLKVNDNTGNLSWEDESGGTGTVTDVTVNGTSVVSDGVASVTVPTNTSDLNNDSGFITASDIPAQVNSDWNASSGVAEILNKPNIKNVPDVGSSDDGKVLKAAYSGGVGSYSWQPDLGGNAIRILLSSINSHQAYDNIVSEYSNNLIFIKADASPIFGPDCLVTSATSAYIIARYCSEMSSSTPSELYTEVVDILISKGTNDTIQKSFKVYNSPVMSFNDFGNISPWNSNSTYIKNEYVYKCNSNTFPPLSGSIYRAKQNVPAQIEPPHSSYWEVVSLDDYYSRLKKVSVSPSSGSIDLIYAYEGKLINSSGDITSITNSDNVDSVVIQWTVSSSTTLPTMPSGYHAASANPTSLTVGKTYQLSLLNDCYSIVEFG